VRHSIGKRTRKLCASVSRAAVLISALGLLLLAGCSGSGGRRAISGTVTLDGAPLDGGSISFRPAPGNPANSAGATITNGAFRMTAAKGLKPGEYLVTVQAFRQTGRMIEDPQMRQQRPEVVPLKFKEGDTLKATILDGGDNRFDFALTGAE